LKVVRRAGQQKRKKTFTFTGLVPEVDFACYNGGTDALERALKERVFFVEKDGSYHPPPSPRLNAFSSSCSLFSKAIKKHAVWTAPMKPRAFALTYHGRKQTVYLKAAEDNERLGFHDNLAHVSAFVKTEKYRFTSTKEPVPRVIQPRSPRFLSETGRYIKPIEKLVYKAIDAVFGYKSVFKGLNAEQRGHFARLSWDAFKDPVAVSGDFKRLDQHVSALALKFEHEIYSFWYPGDRYFKRLMRLQLRNKGFGRAFDGSIKYVVDGRRMSGDSNTAVGNVVIVLGMFYEWLITNNMRIIDDGDDFVIICERKDLWKVNQLVDISLNHGFSLKLEEPVYEFNHIVFCQCQPLFDGDKWLMVRDPRTAISKDLVSLKPLDNESVKRQWLSAVGDGGLSLTRGIPVWDSFYSMMKRESFGAKPLCDPTLDGGFWRLSLGMNRQSKTITDQIRYQFWLSFGILPAAQIVLEEHYNNYAMQVGESSNRFIPLPL